MACNLLETCGRFLYRSPETTIRMSNMLEILRRLKNAKNLDAHHSTLVENAYYMCKPPERSSRISKVWPPLHQVRFYFLRDLFSSGIFKFWPLVHKLTHNILFVFNACSTYGGCFSKILTNQLFNMFFFNYSSCLGQSVSSTL